VPEYACDIAGCDHPEPFKNRAALTSHRKSRHPEAPPLARGERDAAPPPTPPTRSAGGADDPEEIAPNIPGDVRAELEPKPARRSFREWLGLRPRAAAPKDRAPRRKREYTGDLIGAVWSGLGMAAIRTGADVPVGRCLQYQAPIAGELLDGVLADGVIDRVVLQRVARNKESAEAIAALLALPALVFVYERASLEARTVLEPWMEEAVRAHLIAMMPVIKKKQARERELAKVIADAKAEGLIDENAGDAGEVVVGVLNNIFAGAHLDDGRVHDAEFVDDEEVPA
jgi:hypothetical protein